MLATRALARLKEGLRGLYGARLDRVVLYGSHARGDATPESDIDVLVVLIGPVDASREIAAMTDVAYGIELAEGVLFSLVPVAATDYAHAQTPLLRSVRKEGVEA